MSLSELRCAHNVRRLKIIARCVEHSVSCTPNASVIVKNWHVRSIGNQAAPNWSHGTQDNGANFYNHISRKAKKTQKLLVGSTFVDSSKQDHPVSRG